MSRGYVSDDEPPVTLTDARCIRKSERAILFDLNGEEIWIPKSQIVDAESDEFEPGTVGMVTIPAWLATQENLD